MSVNIQRMGLAVYNTNGFIHILRVRHDEEVIYPRKNTNIQLYLDSGNCAGKTKPISLKLRPPVLFSCSKQRLRATQAHPFVAPHEPSLEHGPR